MIGYFGLVVLALFQLNLSEACRKYVPVAKDSAQDRELYSSFIDAIDTDMRNPCNNFYKYACDCYDETNKNSRSRTSRYYHLQHQVKGEKEQLIMDTSRLAYRSQQEGVIRRMLKFRDMCLNTGKSSSECFKDVDQFFYLVVDHLYISSSSVGKSPEVIGYVTNMIENIKASFRLMLKANKKWLDGKGLRGEKVWKGIDPKTGKSVHDTPYEHAKRKIDNMRYIIGGYTYIMNVANLNDIHRNYQIDSTLSYQEVKEKLEQLRRKRDSITSLPADVVGHSIPDGVNMDGFAPSKAADYCNQVTPKDTRISDVNARYDPKLNTFVINYPMLQKPFFDLDYPDAVNYGRLGSIIGHEITHGFDTKGAQNDVNGEISRGKFKKEGSPWMRGSPYDEFMRRVQKVNRVYDTPLSLPPHARFPPRTPEYMRLDVDHTSMENIADQGGVSVAFRALMELNKKNQVQGNMPGTLLAGFHIHAVDQEKQLKKLYFTSYATLYCDTKSHHDNINELRTHLNGDPAQRIAQDVHAPKYARVNVVLGNNEDFIETYSCSHREHSGMIPSEQFSLWTYKP